MSTDKSLEDEMTIHTFFPPGMQVVLLAIVVIAYVAVIVRLGYEGRTLVRTIILKRASLQHVTSDKEVPAVEKEIPVLPKSSLESLRKNIGAHHLLRTNYHSALYKLAEYSRTVEPDFIVGINNAGIMLAAYVAMTLGWSDEKVVRMVVETNSKDAPRYKASFEGKSVLIVDDIMRTGETMRIALEEVQKSGARVTFAATLFSSGSTTAIATLNFFSFSGVGKDAMPPWYVMTHQMDKSAALKQPKSAYLQMLHRSLAEAA